MHVDVLRSGATIPYGAAVLAYGAAYDPEISSCRHAEMLVVRSGAETEKRRIGGLPNPIQGSGDDQEHLRGKFASGFPIADGGQSNTRRSGHGRRATQSVNDGFNGR